MKKKPNEVYVVEAWRYNKYEGGHYLVGVFRSLSNAIKAATNEESFRGGKYTCHIFNVPLDTELPGDLGGFPEVERT